MIEDDDDRCSHGHHDQDCMVRCACGRGVYCRNDYSSCYDCFLDRQAEYVTCLYCGRWHSPAFDTCFKCRPQGRDEAAHELKIVILTRDSYKCRYCGAYEGYLQVDPRLIRPKCRPDCVIEHSHRRPCKRACSRRHQHLKEGDQGLCDPYCATEHSHLIKDDDGVRPAKLHIDHIQPCAKEGTADPWNLQTLCGVCNVSKGSDWWPGSRHYAARRLMVAAYLTYLRDFLTADQQEDLNCDVQSDGLTREYAATLCVRDYADSIKACRPRPRTAQCAIEEDVPEVYRHLDLPPVRTAAS